MRKHTQLRGEEKTPKKDGKLRLVVVWIGEGTTLEGGGPFANIKRLFVRGGKEKEEEEEGKKTDENNIENREER